MRRSGLKRPWCARVMSTRVEWYYGKRAASYEDGREREREEVGERALRLFTQLSLSLLRTLPRAFSFPSLSSLCSSSRSPLLPARRLSPGARRRFMAAVGKPPARSDGRTAFESTACLPERGRTRRGSRRARRALRPRRRVRRRRREESDERERERESQRGETFIFFSSSLFFRFSFASAPLRLSPPLSAGLRLRRALCLCRPPRLRSPLLSPRLPCSCFRFFRHHSLLTAASSFLPPAPLRPRRPRQKQSQLRRGLRAPCRPATRTATTRPAQTQTARPRPRGENPPPPPPPPPAL